MTLTVTIICNGTTRTARGDVMQVAELLHWMKSLMLPRVTVRITDGQHSTQHTYGKDL